MSDPTLNVNAELQDGNRYLAITTISDTPPHTFEIAKDTKDGFQTSTMGFNTIDEAAENIITYIRRQTEMGMILNDLVICISKDREAYDNGLYSSLYLIKDPKKEGYKIDYIEEWTVEGVDYRNSLTISDLSVKDAITSTHNFVKDILGGD